MFYEILCKVQGLAMKGYPASRGQPEASPRPDFFQTYKKTIPRSWSSTAPNIFQIGPMVWISIVDIQTHTHVDFYILDFLQHLIVLYNEIIHFLEAN